MESETQRVAHSGENAFSGEPSWRKYWHLGGHVSVSPQDEALVFRCRHAGNPCCAGAHIGMDDM